MNPLKKGPAIPHLGTRPGGLKGEVANLRRQALDGVLATLGRTVVWSNEDGDAKTWKEVMDIVALGPVGPTILPRYLPSGGGSMIIPAGVHDLRHGKMWAEYVGTNSGSVSVDPGGFIKDLSVIASTQLHFTGGGASPKMDWTDPGGGAPTVLLTLFGGGIQNDGSVPVIVREPGTLLILGAILGESALAPGASPAVRLKSGAMLLTIGIENTTSTTPIPDDSVISDDNTALIGIAHDGWFSGFPNLPGFTGTFANIALSQCGGSGPTAARPLAAFGPVNAGTSYYDTTINKPIVWDGTTWRDYAGNPV